MDVTTGFFYLFSVVLLYAAFRVITAPNPVHAVLHLMLAFSQAAGIWLLLKAEFLAIVLVMVYLGAVMVLFLFVVMMLDIRLDHLRKSFWKNFPLAAVIFAIVAFEMGVVLIGGFSSIDTPKAIPAVVDAAGHVTNASVSSPTNISDAQTRSAAVAAARNTRFSAGNGVSVGTITYNFKLK